MNNHIKIIQNFIDVVVTNHKFGTSYPYQVHSILFYCMGGLIIAKVGYGKCYKATWKTSTVYFGIYNRYYLHLLRTCSESFCDKFYVRTEIFEGQFCTTPNTINNKDISKIQNARASLRKFKITFCF